MLEITKQLNNLTQRHLRSTVRQGLAGGLLITVAAYNWRLWQRDKRVLKKAQVQAKATCQLTEQPPVSVLVAAWNEGGRIEDHLRSFQSLYYPQIELIICAGGSDDTFERARRYQDSQGRITVLEQHPGEGKQVALARCYQHAKADFIYLTDADCLFNDRALQGLLAPLVNEGEQVATGLSRPLTGQIGRLLPLYSWAAETFAAHYSPTYINGLLGRNALLTRNAIARSGGLDFVALTGTDYQLGKRLLASGLAIRHIKQSVVASEYPQTLRAYRHKQSRWLRNLLLHGPRYAAYGDVRVTLKTMLVGLMMLVAPLVGWTLSPELLVGWAGLLTHVLVSRLRYIAFTMRLYDCKSTALARLGVGLLPLTLFDFITWVLPAFDLLISKRRHKW